jgi:hypothetical protein
MSESWDQDFNTLSVPQEVLNRIRDEENERRWAEERATLQEQRRSRGYIDSSYISNELIRVHFPRWTDASVEDNSWSDGHLAIWQANRMIWICHRCGAFGYKYSLRETFKCYCCRSRNVQVLRSGEVSLAIRSIVPATEIGTNMQDIYLARRERMRTARLARRNT